MTVLVKMLLLFSVTSLVKSGISLKREEKTKKKQRKKKKKMSSLNNGVKGKLDLKKSKQKSRFLHNSLHRKLTYDSVMYIHSSG